MLSYFARKVLLPLSILVSFALLGCSSGGATTSDKQDQQEILDRRIGEIQTLSNSVTESEGTHLLRMADGKTILLHSSTIDLGDERYKDQTVEVSGALTYSQGNTQIMEVENVDILESTGMEEEELKPLTWKNYSHSLLGFSLQYRDDFTMDEQENRVTFTKTLEDSASEVENTETTESTEGDQKISIMVEVIAKPEGQFLGEYLGQSSQEQAAETSLVDGNADANSTETEASNHLPPGFSQSKIGEQNLDAFKAEKDKKIEFYTESGSKIYHLVFDGSEVKQDLNEEINIFYQLVNSFKLLSLSSSKPSTSASTGSPGLVNNENASSTPESENETQTEAPSSSPANSLIANDEKENETVSSSIIAKENVTPDEIEIPSDYELFESSGYKFSVYYPKKWYFEGTDYKDDTVLKRYTFGTKPLDEEPGILHLDIVSGKTPQGTEVVSNGKKLIQVENGEITEFYYTNEKGRIYRISGDSSNSEILKNMAGSLGDNSN